MFTDKFVKCKGRSIAAAGLTAEEIHEVVRLQRRDIRRYRRRTD